jgi:hypothetical protein
MDASMLSPTRSSSSLGENSYNENSRFRVWNLLDFLHYGITSSIA